MSSDDRILVREGGNSWLIARTDRDDADRDSVIEGAGQILARWLNGPSPMGYRGIFQVLHRSAAGARLVIGAARPVLITIGRDASIAPPGDPELGVSAIDREVLRMNARAPGLGEGPGWFVRADFEWLASDTRLPWPYHAAAVLGTESLNDRGLDWLLVSACQPPFHERASRRASVMP